MNLEEEMNYISTLLERIEGRIDELNVSLDYFKNQERKNFQVKNIMELTNQKIDRITKEKEIVSNILNVLTDVALVDPY